jgi:hypothetical protein
LERGFLPGRVFSSPADFNTQLQAWLVRANHRRHQVLVCRPADRIEADKAAMLALPPVGPTVGWRASKQRAKSGSPAGAGALPMAVMAVRAGLECLADGLVERLQRRVELLLALVCEAGFALMQ